MLFLIKALHVHMRIYEKNRTHSNTNKFRQSNNPELKNSHKIAILKITIWK